MAAFIAKQESELAKAFRNQVILKSRDTGLKFLEQAIASNSIKTSFDIEAALEILYGLLFFRLLTGYQPLNPALAKHLVEILFDGIATVT